MKFSNRKQYPLIINRLIKFKFSKWRTKKIFFRLDALSINSIRVKIASILI